MKIPDLADVLSTGPGKATVPAKKPVRPQPKGLKMRYQPFGSGNDGPVTIGSASTSEDEDDSDEDMEDAPPTFKMPEKIAEDSSSEEESEEEEESSESDEEMPDVPVVPVKPTPSSKSGTKRKLEDGGSKKAPSLSTPVPQPKHSQLKHSKKQTSVSPTRPSPSPSTEDDEDVHETIRSQVKATSILPPKKAASSDRFPKSDITPSNFSSRLKNGKSSASTPGHGSGAARDTASRKDSGVNGVDGSSSKGNDKTKASQKTKPKYREWVPDASSARISSSPILPPARKTFNQQVVDILKSKDRSSPEPASQPKKKKQKVT